jgi:hypothetical protein
VAQEMVAQNAIEQKIFLLRGQKAMLDRDLAYLYGVSTKVLNQAVKRNVQRFPGDFMFQLTELERDELVTNCDRFGSLKYSSALPYAFTEQGVAMLSSVLKSERAIQVNIQIMRVFTRLRQMLATHMELAQKLEEHEQRLVQHDGEIATIFEAMRQLMAPPDAHRKNIGFKAG